MSKTKKTSTIAALVGALGIASLLVLGCPKLSPSQFSLTAVQPIESVPIGGTAQFQLNANGPAQAKGTATFIVSGLPTGAIGSVAPSTLNHPGAVLVTVNTGSAAPGTYKFSVVGSAAGQSITTTLTIIVGPPALASSPMSCPGATVGVAFTCNLAPFVSGGTPPYSFTVNSGALPAGLSLSAAGEISGTPTAVGTFNSVIAITDSGTTPQVVHIETQMNLARTSKGT